MNATYISSAIALLLVILGTRKYSHGGLANAVIAFIIADFLVGIILFGQICLSVEIFGEKFQFETGLGLHNDVVKIYNEWIDGSQ